MEVFSRKVGDEIAFSSLSLAGGRMWGGLQGRRNGNSLERDGDSEKEKQIVRGGCVRKLLQQQ